MDPAEKDSMKQSVGCGGYSDERCVDMFIDGGAWYRKFCHALGVRTQEDNVAQATFDAAKYAKGAFFATLIIGLITIFLAIFSLMR
jgi:hypothetical protein